MKTKLLIVFLALMPVVLSAQGGYSSVLWDASLDLHGEIVRSWGTDFVLTYHNEASGNLFSLTRVIDFHSAATPAGPIAAGMKTDPLPASMQVCDVRILNDEAFFCGSMNGKAMVGRLNLNDFSTSSVNVEYAVASTSATRYKKLVVFDHFSSVRIVACIGEDAGNNYRDVASVYSFASSFSHLQTYKLPSEEDMDDILYTGDTVVLVGRHNDVAARNELIIRRCSSSSLPTSLSDRTIYPSSVYEINGQTRSLFLNGFSSTPVVAVSYVHLDPLTQNFHTRVRYIDIRTMAMVRSHAFARMQKDEVQAIVYSQTAHRLAVMFTELVAGYTSDVTKTVLLQPDMNVSHQGEVLYFPPPYSFTSADILNDPSSGDIDIVHAGHGRWNLQHIPSAGLSAGFCPIVEYMPIRAIADLMPYAIPLAMPPGPLTITQTTWTTARLPLPINTLCFMLR